MATGSKSETADSQEEGIVWKKTALLIIDMQVVREHHPSGWDVELFRKHFYENGKKGLILKGSNGAALVEGLVPIAGEYVLAKSRFSAFFATNLDLLLRRAGISNIVVTGVQTPNCIRATVFDAVALDYPSVSVLADATAAASPTIHTANLLDIQNIGVSTPTLAAWIQRTL